MSNPKESTNYANSGGTPIVAMVRCSGCGHLVPEPNMELHLIRACEARKTRATTRETTRETNNNDIDSNSNSSSEEDDISYMEIDDVTDHGTSAAAVDLTTASASPPPRARNNNNNNPGGGRIDARITSAAACLARASSWEDLTSNDENSSAARRGSDRGEKRTLRESSNNNDNDDNRKQPAQPKNEELINLLDDDDDDEELSSGDDEDDVEEQWTCHRCTLLNPMEAPACEACDQPNPHRVRQPDRARRERLIPDSTSGFHHPQVMYHDRDQYNHNATNNNGPSYLTGGAFVGGLLGAAASYAQGRSITSGALHGVLNGAIGGALVEGVMRDSSQTPTISRRSTANNDPGNFFQQHNQQHQRAVQNATAGRRHGMQTRSTTVITTPEGTQVFVNRVPAFASDDDGSFDPMTAMMLQAMMGSPHRGGGAGNIDGMSYDQLLQRFGDGSENMGASEGQISSLPESVVQNVESLPVDSRQCSICLEDFKSEDKRKILPCLHGFHKKCIVKWLRQNGACPICKFRIKDSGNN